MVEYAFGDWRYYGLGERSLWRGAVALLTPTDSTLGRRILPLTEDAESFHTVAGSVRSTRLLVEKGRADELLVRLDARYRQAIETQVSNDWSDLAFVLDNRNYHLFRNSNHQVAQWLRELDCEVRGNPILSNFQVEEDQ